MVICQFLENNQGLLSLAALVAALGLALYEQRRANRADESKLFDACYTAEVVIKTVCEELEKVLDKKGGAYLVVQSMTLSHKVLESLLLGGLPRAQLTLIVATASMDMHKWLQSQSWLANTAEVEKVILRLRSFEVAVLSAVPSPRYHSKRVQAELDLKYPKALA